MKHLKALENAYRALLSLSPVKRLDFQAELIGVRDAIAEITGDDVEIVQEKFESHFVESIEFHGSMVGGDPIDIMGNIYYA